MYPIVECEDLICRLDNISERNKVLFTPDDRGTLQGKILHKKNIYPQTTLNINILPHINALLIIIIQHCIMIGFTVTTTVLHNQHFYFGLASMSFERDI